MVGDDVAYNETRLLSCSIPRTPECRVTATASQGKSAVQLALWAGLTAVLVIGLVLYFRFANHIVPLLDAVTEK